MEKSKIVEQAINLGAHDARVIRVDAVKTAAWVALKCRYGCDHYGKSLCCPPHTPTYKETREVLKDYSYAVLIQCRTLEETTDLALNMEHALFKLGYHKAIGFGAGKCLLCSDCTMALCTRPLEARPSMEACGMDVMATVQASGIPIRSVADGRVALGLESPHSPEDSSYFGYGLILID